MSKHLLEEVLKKKKISKRKFAKLLAIEYANVFRYFRPDYDPKLSTLDKWAEVLEIKIKDLIEENNSARRSS